MKLLHSYIEYLRLNDPDYKLIKKHIKFSQKKNLEKFIYYYNVWKLTEFNSVNVSEIHLRNIDNHLDHIIPIKIGFQYNINPSIIGCQSNLRIISKTENLKKGSLLTKDSLDKLVEFEIYLESILLVSKDIFHSDIIEDTVIYSDNPKSLLYYETR